MKSKIAKNIVALSSIFLSFGMFFANTIEQDHIVIIYVIAVILLVIGVLLLIPWLKKLTMLFVIILDFIYFAFFIAGVMALIKTPDPSLIFFFIVLFIPLCFSVLYFVLFLKEKKKVSTLKATKIDAELLKSSTSLSAALNNLLTAKNKGEITEEEYLAKKKDLIGY